MLAAVSLIFDSYGVFVNHVGLRRSAVRKERACSVMVAKTSSTLMLQSLQRSQSRGTGTELTAGTPHRRRSPCGRAVHAAFKIVTATFDLFESCFDNSTRLHTAALTFAF